MADENWPHIFRFKLIVKNKRIGLEHPKWREKLSLQPGPKMSETRRGVLIFTFTFLVVLPLTPSASRLRPIWLTLEPISEKLA